MAARVQAADRGHRDAFVLDSDGERERRVCVRLRSRCRRHERVLARVHVSIRCRSTIVRASRKGTKKTINVCK